MFTHRFNHYDLQPNIGLFWYFFAEMFEHFRTLFLYTFQMNATVLYLMPLTIKLHRQPLLLTTILTSLIAVFRSYPCVGDVAFYMALFPMWRRSSKCMYILVIFFIITKVVALVQNLRCNLRKHFVNDEKLHRFSIK